MNAKQMLLRELRAKVLRLSLDLRTYQVRMPDDHEAGGLRERSGTKVGQQPDDRGHHFDQRTRVRFLL